MYHTLAHLCHACCLLMAIWILYMSGNETPHLIKDLRKCNGPEFGMNITVKGASSNPQPHLPFFQTYEDFGFRNWVIFSLKGCMCEVSCTNSV